MHTSSPKNITADKVQNLIAEMFGIKSTKPPEPIGESIENATWKVVASKEEYIVKIFGHNSAEKDVLEEVLLYEYLLQHEITVPEVISSVVGKKVTIIDDHPMILMKYETELKEITSSDLSQEQQHIMARTIARMHKALQNYPRLENIRPAKQNAQSIHNHSLQDFDMFLSSPNARSPFLQDHDRLRKIRGGAIAFLAKQKLVEGLTTAVLHNDLALGHILFFPNDKVYIFDFSDFVYGPVALDLAVLFFNLYREGEITFEKWQNMIEEFLSVYSNSHQLTSDDKKAIQIYMISRMLEHIRYLDRMSLEEGYPVDDKGIKKRYDLLELLFSK